MPANLPTAVYVGIDVACAKHKPLPICVLVSGKTQSPMQIPRELAETLPRGLGNSEVLSKRPFHSAAQRLADALLHISSEMKWNIRRIAIDAPAEAPHKGTRVSEQALGVAGLSSFRTPSKEQWPSITARCRQHLSDGGTVARLPNANKIWMLFGFELFACLSATFNAELIEVYPYAIVRALLPECGHKSTEEGYLDQLRAVASRSGWRPNDLEATLKMTVRGARHDRLDAFMAAWVASLPRRQRRPYGDPRDPRDAIWVPGSLAARS